jgi:hypothetical protein
VRTSCQHQRRQANASAIETWRRAPTHVSKCVLADIRDHRERRNSLFLDPAFAGRLEHGEETLDDRVEVGQEDLAFDTLAHVDER